MAMGPVWSSADRTRRRRRPPTLAAMSASIWTLVFAATLVASLARAPGQSARQARHVLAHRDAVPPQFRATVDLAAHRKAADYTLAKIRFGQVQMVFAAVVLLGWTLFGGLDALSCCLPMRSAPAGMGWPTSWRW